MLIPPHLVNEHFCDRYFDVVSAIDEAQQIYFRNNNLLERLAAKSSPQFVIGELGFGAGRILVSLMEYLRKSHLKDISIDYNSVEMYPMCPDRMYQLLNEFRDRVGDEIHTLIEAYKTIQINQPGWHKMKIHQGFGIIEVNLWIGEALEMVNALDKCCDVWFLDGHSPKKNPSIWRPELLLEIGKKTKPNGTCSTFTVAGAVRRALADAGFTINKLPGCGVKNEVLQGVISESR